MLRSRPRYRTFAPNSLTAAIPVIVAVIALVLVASLLAPISAQAEVYHVKLHNGTTIDTAYQPQQASWDPSLVVLLADTGNWIGIPQKDIDSVKSESALHGFGISLNYNTVAIGWAPNDAVDPATIKADPNAAMAQALQNLYQQRAAEQHYSIQQFVNTDQTTGIPASFIGGGRVPQIPVPAPAAPMIVPSAPAAGPGSGGPNQ